MKHKGKILLALLAVAILIAALLTTLIACNDDGHKVQRRHQEGDWIIDFEPTCGEVGHRHTECVTCHRHLSEEDIPATGQHTVNDEWMFDATSHWHPCDNCNVKLDRTNHNFGEWMIDGNYACGDTTTRHRDCAICDYSQVEENFYVDHELGEWIIDSEPSCMAKGHRHKECANCDYTLEEDYGEIVPHELDPTTKKCRMCQSNDFITGDALFFGEYPQTKVKDNGIINVLNGMSGNRPVKVNRGKWTDYGYYIGKNTDSKGQNGTPAKEEYMWYIDLEYQGARYRGVYFTSYRPYQTAMSGLEEYSFQFGYEYYINTLYWFKWEPIEWRVLERTDEEIFLMSNAILDSQQYYRSTSWDRNIDGKAVYPNNYKESDIRAWLNDAFLNQAFDALEQGMIKTTIVDNGALTTSSDTNGYVCENTGDKVFLLSYQDVLDANHGFSSDSSIYNTARRLEPTEYARSQGAYASTESGYNGNGWWWLRSPYDKHGDYALLVRSDGSVNIISDVTNTGRGVVPAIKIDLT